MSAGVADGAMLATDCATTSINESALRFSEPAEEWPEAMLGEVSMESKHFRRAAGGCHAKCRNFFVEIWRKPHSRGRLCHTVERELKYNSPPIRETRHSYDGYT